MVLHATVSAVEWETGLLEPAKLAALAKTFAAEGFDAWAAATASAGGRHLHPSSRLWAGRDSGTILDDDGVGNAVPSPAAEWCAEAVQPGNLEVWASPLSGHRLAVSLLNRSPTAQTISADWAALGLASGAKRAVRDVWQAKDVGEHSGSYSVEVGAFDVALLVLSSA